MYETTYEVWDMNTGKVFAKNLTFNEAAEKSDTYQHYLGDAVCMAFRESDAVYVCITPAQEYKSAWIEYFGTLQEMGNLY